ncbi:MAG: hypothetical protein KatS3mg008_1789 [Acidimicrobiales bacterium]|nr:MAG: hypothetical protein KatS3mg008_1789 [Acidimicrobiales bacterium]
MSRPPIEDRVKRIILALSYLADRKSATLQELAQVCETDVETMRNELLLATMCGTPPYTPDELIEIIFEPDEQSPPDQTMVVARIPAYFDAPPVFGMPERFSLYASAKRILAIQEWPDLRKAVEKISSHFGDNPDALDVVEEDAEILPALNSAISEARRVIIDYWAESTGETTERKVDPLKIEERGGYSYLIAYDHTRNGIRVFRTDRIANVHEVDETFDASEHNSLATSDDLLRSGVGDRVLVRVPKNEAWVIDYTNGTIKGEDEDYFDMQLEVYSENWLIRVLLQAGPGCKIIRPPNLNMKLIERAQELIDIAEMR